jgi:hypothetical protein
MTCLEFGKSVILAQKATRIQPKIDTQPTFSIEVVKEKYLLRSSVSNLDDDINYNLFGIYEIEKFPCSNNS